MNQATYDDANLLLKLYEIRREDKMRKARDWFVANFKFKNVPEYMSACPPGSDENAFARQVTSYWEMVASFVNNGVLNQDLFFTNSRELLLCWLRVKPIIEDLRGIYEDPMYLGNLEKCGKAFAEWIKKTSGEKAFATWAGRVGA